MRLGICIWITALGLGLTIPAQADEPAAEENAHTDLVWHLDYAQAQRLARLQGKMLLVYFHADEKNTSRQGFETSTLANARVRAHLQKYVLAKLPMDTVVKLDGKEKKLLDHPAFREMLGRQGLAIVDYDSEDPKLNGQVVSVFPFPRGRYYATQAMNTILELPSGLTLTQRTMIYAVRMHPEAPKSAQGGVNDVLADEAEKHSKHQAAIGVQGHHSWESRFHRINGRLGTGDMSQEVVAESWPGQTLVEAAEECVHSWRQSPGHWGAVRARHRGFGYDMKRGSNGIWYATGIFANR